MSRDKQVAAMKRCACGYLPLPDATNCPKCGKPIGPAEAVAEHNAIRVGPGSDWKPDA